MAFNNLFKFLYFIVVISVLLATIIESLANPMQGDRDVTNTHILLEKQEWIHGSADCNLLSEPLIQVVQYNRNTWILRQNKCVHYEAPFMYLFMGKNRALLVDTGATENESTFPLYDTVIDLLKSGNNKSLPLIVAHSHSHSDHYAGDRQFKGKTNVSVVGLELDDVKTFFNINQWPDEVSDLDLGERIINVLPIPGHEVASFAFYDSTSKLLITGYTFYPGRLYVFDWISFKQSISKLYDFASQHDISYIVGTHIEMSLTAGKDYVVGSTYHPEEQKLPLTVEELCTLNDALRKTSDTPERILFDKFIVVPK